MSLRAQAERDLAAILESSRDFGWPVTVTAPDGTSADLHGQSANISLTIDPDTGALVTGQRATMTLRLASLAAEFDSLPVHVPSGVPWLVAVTDITGAAGTFKVVDSMPDRTLGVVTLELESYVVAPN